MRKIRTPIAKAERHIALDDAIEEHHRILRAYLENTYRPGSENIPRTTRGRDVLLKVNAPFTIGDTVEHLRFPGIKLLVTCAFSHIVRRTQRIPIPTNGQITFGDSRIPADQLHIKTEIKYKEIVVTEDEVLVGTVLADGGGSLRYHAPIEIQKRTHWKELL